MFAPQESQGAVLLWKLMDHANLAEALLREGKYEAALAVAKMGVSADPNNPEHYVNLANALDGLDRYGEALDACNAAIAFDPAGKYASAAYDVQALIFTSLGDSEKAFAAARRALEIPQYDLKPLTTMGNVLAWHGELKTALPFVEWNWIREQRSCAERFKHIEQWDGGSLEGRSLFVAHEQGYGDAIQMARYLPLLKSRAKRVVVECAPGLTTLLSDTNSVDEVVELYTTAEATACDCYVRMMTLPRILGIDAPQAFPYLRADGFAKSDGPLRAGIAWAGSSSHVFDYERSMKYEAIEPLFHIENIRWTPLIGDAFTDFSETAKAISQLDLVISVDTAVAHLAGALGRPTWLMLPRRAEWRWGGGGDTTLWYPRMRLFRETTARWSTVVARVEEALRVFASMHEIRHR